MAFPKTKAELEAAGYRRLESRSCDGDTCYRIIQIWSTPKGKRIPLEVDAEGNVTPHHATCPDVKQFRKAKR